MNGWVNSHNDVSAWRQSGLCAVLRGMAFNVVFYPLVYQACHSFTNL